MDRQNNGQTDKIMGGQTNKWMDMQCMCIDMQKTDFTIDFKLIFLDFAIDFAIFTMWLQTYGWADGQTNGQNDGQTDEIMGEQTNEWMDMQYMCIDI